MKNMEKRIYTNNVFKVFVTSVRFLLTRKSE